MGGGGLTVTVGGWGTGLSVSEYTVMLGHQTMTVGSFLSGSDMRSVRLGKSKTTIIKKRNNNSKNDEQQSNNNEGNMKNKNKKKLKTPPKHPPPQNKQTNKKPKKKQTINK